MCHLNSYTVHCVGLETKYSGEFSSIGKIFKDEGLLGLFVSLIPHILEDAVFLQGCNLLATSSVPTWWMTASARPWSSIPSYSMGVAVA